jgi:hypothetical protein
MPVAGGGELGRRLAADAQPALDGPRAGRAFVPDLDVGPPVGRRLGG